MLSIAKLRMKVETEVIGYKLHKLAFAVDRRVDQRIQDKYGISYSQFLILFGVDRSVAPTQCAVAKFLNLTQAAVSRQIDNLVETGCIQRVENTKNRREHLLTITPSGQYLLAKVKTEVTREYKELFEVISAYDLRVFGRVLDSLLNRTCAVSIEGQAMSKK